MLRDVIFYVFNMHGYGLRYLCLRPSIILITPLLTLGAHAQQRLWYLVLSVCMLSDCVPPTHILPLRAIRRQNTVNYEQSDLQAEKHNQ